MEARSSSGSVSRDTDPSLKRGGVLPPDVSVSGSVSRDTDPSLKQVGCDGGVYDAGCSVSRDTDPSLKLKQPRTNIPILMVFGQ